MGAFTTGMALSMAEIWGSSIDMPIRPYSYPVPSRGRSGVPAAKRAAKKRRNIKARAKK